MTKETKGRKTQEKKAAKLVAQPDPPHTYPALNVAQVRLAAMHALMAEMTRQPLAGKAVTLLFDRLEEQLEKSDASEAWPAPPEYSFGRVLTGGDDPSLMVQQLAAAFQLHAWQVRDALLEIACGATSDEWTRQHRFGEWAAEQAAKKGGAR